MCAINDTAENGEMRYIFCGADYVTHNLQTDVDLQTDLQMQAQRTSVYVIAHGATRRLTQLIHKFRVIIS